MCLVAEMGCNILLSGWLCLDLYLDSLVVGGALGVREVKCGGCVGGLSTPKSMGWVGSGLAWTEGW